MQPGEHLAHLRKLRGLSQRQVAEELGVTRQSVSHWEAGGAFPSAEKQIALSQLYGVPPEELYPPTNTEEEVVEIPEIPEKPKPEEPDRLPPTAETAWEEQRRKRRQRRKWLALALAVTYVAIYIWGKLTRSSGAAGVMIINISIIVFIGAISCTFFRVADCLIDYLRWKSHEK